MKEDVWSSEIKRRGEKDTGLARMNVIISINAMN